MGNHLFLLKSSMFSLCSVPCITKKTYITLKNTNFLYLQIFVKKFKKIESFFFLLYFLSKILNIHRFLSMFPFFEPVSYFFVKKIKKETRDTICIFYKFVSLYCDSPFFSSFLVSLQIFYKKF